MMFQPSDGEDPTSPWPVVQGIKGTQLRKASGWYLVKEREEAKNTEYKWVGTETEAGG